jgi:hypothetical protein
MKIFADQAKEFYMHALKDAQENFDVGEITFSHLLRKVHPALGNRNYSEAFLDSLYRHGLIRSNSFLEVGGGTGWFAKSFLDYLKKRSGRLYRKCHYRILDISHILSMSQKKLLKNSRVDFINADALMLPFGDKSFKGIVISNLCIADFGVVKIKKDWLGKYSRAANGSYGRREQTLQALRYIRKYKLDSQDLPESFFLNTGAIRFIEEIGRIALPATDAVIAEYAVQDKYPQEADFAGHREYAIYFDHLVKVAEHLGFKTHLLELEEFLGIDTTTKFLSLDNFTQKRQIISEDTGLALLRRKNISFPTLGYTRGMLLREISKQKYRLTRSEIEEVMAKCEDGFFTTADFSFDSTNPNTWKFKVLILRK